MSGCWKAMSVVAGVTMLSVGCIGAVSGEKLDYSKHKVLVTDVSGAGYDIYGMSGTAAQDLVDGHGAEPCPSAWGVWVRDKTPTPDKPAVLVFDYGIPVKVAALAHYFYVPGSRDQRWQDWLSGPSAFREVRILTSNDNVSWKEASHLTDMEFGFPQMLTIKDPVSARYLKLEVLSMALGAGWLRSYEMETYLNDAPKSLPSSAKAKPVRRGFPFKPALARASAAQLGTLKLNADGKRLDFTLPGPGLATPATGKLDIRVNDQPVCWEGASAGRSMRLTGRVGDAKLDMEASFVKAGLLLKFLWHGPIAHPFSRLDVLAGMDAPIKEWCVPEYFYSDNIAPASPIRIPSVTVPAAISMVGDGKTAITLVPDTDRSWVGVEDKSALVSFPLDSETPQVMVLASSGNWFSGFERAAVDVFNFDEPRQFSPVSKAIPEICGYLLQPSLWSDKHQMLRSFPDVDFFYIFYSLPYAIPALTYWEELSGDKSVSRKIDQILKFTLDQKISSGPMKGAIFSEYADRDIVDKGQVPYGYTPYYTWHTKYPDERLVGMDQGCNRWITAHNMGAVLWSITHVWRGRGRLSDDVLAGARDIADWMLRYQQDDGSWAYAYREDGSIASPMSDSGTIWNVWSLWRFGKLTGDKRYSDAAEKGFAYFKKTFAANHLYRGYWEDNYAGEKTTLNTAQGYESSIASLAFAEIGDFDTMRTCSRDSLRFVCTRVLECRDYWTSYGGASEQQGWAPGTYIAPTLGYAAHLAWRKTGDDTLRRFSGLAKTMGWWQDACGGAFWLLAAVRQQPIDMYRTEGGGRQFWALWESAQKVTFAVPWLVDEVNRRSGDRIKLNTESLSGTDDRGVSISAAVFDGVVESKSGQVNWLGLKSTSANHAGEYQLVLVNHAEATDVTVSSSLGRAPSSARM